MSGEERNSQGNCIPCRRGFYKDNSLGAAAMFGACVRCENGLLTPGVASTSASDCTLSTSALYLFL